MTQRTKKDKINRILCMLFGLILTVFFCVPVRALDKGEAGITGELADDTGKSPAVIREFSDYRDISAVIAGDEDNDYFGSILVEQSGTGIIKDGGTESFAEEFDISEKEAEHIVRSEASIEEFLEESDTETIYNVEENKNGDIEITAPYQTKRLIINDQVEADVYGARSVYYNTKDKETILEFETEEETRLAYKKACERYGEPNCYVDEIFYAGDVLKSTDTASAPGPAACWSWGNKYMKMNYLRTQAGYYGYHKKITVAVIDSGVDKSNSLFGGGRISGQSWNFFNGNKNISDAIGHGSHVSGIIADATPSNVKILMLKVTDSKGRGSLYAIKSALRYAVSRKVQVINMSMGVTGKKAAKINYLNDIIRTAYYKGIPVCAAAGNEGTSVKASYPANTKLPITIAAINTDGSRGSYIDSKTGKKLYYSNYGSTVDFAAPGTDIISAGKGGSYYYMTGTSMAAPHVTAAIAYIKMLKPNLSVAGVEKQLKAMSVDLGPKGKDKYFGWGCPSLGNLFRKGIMYKNDTVRSVVGRPVISRLKNEKKGVKITWKKVKKAEQYKIYRKTSNGKYKRIATVASKNLSCTDRKVSEGKTYTYIVKAFRYGISGKKSAEKKIVCVKTVANLTAGKKSRTKLTLKWKKKKKISGYQIRYSASRSMKKGKVITVKSNKKQIVKLKCKYCYYQVRAYKKTGGKTYYSAWSAMNRLRMR